MLTDKKGLIEIVRLLISSKADFNSADINGETPVISAADPWRPDILKLFLSNRADVNAKNCGGNSLLHFAVKNGSLEVVKHLFTNDEIMENTLELSNHTRRGALSPTRVKKLKASMNKRFDLNVFNVVF